ncbi:N-acetylmuramoyl-L-alanine amidase family protein [Lacrimispora sp.]|uniref:N-acetylmuramoyl-L-alanine amidase family protein n=1 Tax=Lacrimispora sp. TaxID=2719234 RepID=UPI0029E1F18D|nr:hypothetical protein [Lacrimispora sp.]
MIRRKGKGTWLLLLCMIMVLGTGISASASGSLKIYVENGSKSSWTDGINVPTVKVNYSEESPSWSKDEEDWEPGKKVKGTIQISGTYERGDCSIKGAKLLSVKNEDGETVITFSYIPVAKLESPERAGWSDNAKTKASWKKVPFASRYQIVLYQENGIWIKSLTTSSTSVDLLPYMNSGYKYYYTVKAILKDSSEEDYLREGDTITSDDSVVQELGETLGVWSNYPNGKKYRAEDGNYVTDGWKMISGNWYYFKPDGYAATGWQKIDNKWYYMDSDAVMKTGWQQLNGVWYFLNTDGDMAIGWIQPSPGKWYYLNEDGSLAMNTTVDGTYKVNESGLWIQ